MNEPPQFLGVIFRPQLSITGGDALVAEIESRAEVVHEKREIVLSPF